MPPELEELIKWKGQGVEYGENQVMITHTLRTSHLSFSENAYIVDVSLCH